jgi:hypothetical protein
MRYFNLFLFSIFCIPVFASDSMDYFSLTFENDVFYHEDDGYSNGVTFNWGYYDVAVLNDSSLPEWISSLAQASYISTLEERQYAIHYSFGQYLQTATDISISELVEDDAPYVGLLAWKISIAAYNQSILDELSLTLGVVGPIAGAEYSQKYLHSWINANEPEGWDNQINNEAVFQVQANRIWRNFTLPLGNTEIDLITGIHAGAGNLLSDANLGIGLRWGQELDANFSSSSPFLVQKLNGPKASVNGWYVFANLSAGYVANDIFIDGNTFQNSHSVDLIHWQAGVAIGAQINIYDWNIIYSTIYGTDQYESQTDKVRWANITITHHF